MRPLISACFALALMAAAAGKGLGQSEQSPDYTHKSVPQWIQVLKDKENPEARIEARLALGPRGPYTKVAIPALINAFADKEPPYGSDAAEALADYGPTVVPVLVRALKRPEAPVRAGVAQALGQVRPKAIDAIPALLDALKDSAPAVRAAAAWSLGDIGKAAQQAVPSLIRALQDKDGGVRYSAAYALSEMSRKSKPAIPALISALKDREEGVQEFAADALCRLGPDARAAVPALIEALKNKKETWWRWNMARALAAIGPEAKEAVPALIEALQEQNEHLQGWAITALGEIGPGAKAGVPALIRIAKDNRNKARSHAIRALGMIGPEANAAVPVLLQALGGHDPGSYLSRTVADALGGIGREAQAAIPALTALARDRFADSQARKAAAEAVVKIDPDTAARLNIESACLDIRLGKIAPIKLAPRAAFTEEQKQRIRAMIRNLAEVAHPDVGFSATLSGYAFAPLPEQEHVEGGLLTDHQLKTSTAFRSLVERGPEALPFLLEALEDKTPTKLNVTSMAAPGFMGFSDELTGNPLNPLEKRVLAKPWERADEEREESLGSYTVRVGDFCFVTIGQIVGRPYQAVRYQPSGMVLINSPVQSRQLRERVRAIWANKDPARMLLDSLLTDYATQGIYNGRTLDGWGEGSDRQIKSVLRLLYYFPEETAPLLAARLRSFDVRDRGRPPDTANEKEWNAYRDRWANREVRNGVLTDEFIKAISWCRAPAIQKALADLAKRTDDPDIKAALEHSRRGDR
jgi:HEAT repeat protein